MVRLNRTVEIYGLIDPRDLRVKYVGQSFNARYRLTDHIRFAQTETTKKAEWIRSLLSASLQPLLVVVDVVPEVQADAAERRWIAAFARSGLTNMTAGGFRINFTPEVRAKIGAANRAALIGKPKTAAHIAKLRGPKTETHKAKLRAAALRRYAK